MFERFLKLTLLLALTACQPLTPKPPTQPAWALGEQPSFSGSIIEWAKGDAIAPGEGGMFATTYATGDPDGVDIGFGTIKADSSFTFGLQKGASSAGGGLNPDQALCAGLQLSNPNQKVVGVELIKILSLYEEGVHARPDGGIFISVGQPLSSSMKALYTFFYASQSGTVKGSCDIEEVGGAPFDLDLRTGWNSVRRDASGFKTAALATDAKWYFFNTLTAP